MGYTTDFVGEFTLNTKLADNHYKYLISFSNTRRMKRDSKLAESYSDPVRNSVVLPIGDEGEYYVGASGFMGQSNDESIVNYNDPPSSQPGLWCQWVPSFDRTKIEWNGGEKFYNYVEWLEYLISNFIKPWGYVLNGDVDWRGEDWDDAGTISVKDNVVSVLKK